MIEINRTCIAATIAKKKTFLEQTDTFETFIDNTICGISSAVFLDGPRAGVHGSQREGENREEERHQQDEHRGKGPWIARPIPI